MGLKITTPLHTNKGQTTEMYLNIQNVILNKMNMNHASINRYFNKEARDNNVNDVCDCFEVKSTYLLDLEISEFETKYFYELIYEKIKLDLESKGFTVENL